MSLEIWKTTSAEVIIQGRVEEIAMARQVQYTLGVA